MVLFQELEFLLKLIVANTGSISGYADELSLKREQRAANIQKQTMGQLVGQYLKITDPEYQEFSYIPIYATTPIWPASGLVFFMGAILVS